jgi:hypothetical protein
VSALQQEGLSSNPNPTNKEKKEEIKREGLYKLKEREISKKILKILLHKNKNSCLAPVVQVYNPSYLGGRDQ